MPFEQDPELLFVDLFCGAGGVTTGIEHAKSFDRKVALVMSCVNHDANAIASHALNHPDCEHYTEDIRTLDVSNLVRAAIAHKARYPNARLCLWASLECTHFSKARGGLPKDADSRTLAEHLYRYIEAFDFAGISFDAIFIENVEEFMSWGPLDAKGKPISRDKGIDYVKWRDHICRYGFNYEYRILNAADFGAYTSRKRYFGIFSRIAITWPKQTHSRKQVPGLDRWKPVRHVLSLEKMGENIFERERPYAEATLERIYNGLVKRLPEGLAFIDYYYGHGFSTSLNVPAGTVTTKDRMNLVHFLLFPQWGTHCSHSIDRPSPVLPARMDKMYPYVIGADKTPAPVVIKPTDSYWSKKIKEFMIANGIAEVRMRPLDIPELQRIQGLDNQKLVGTIAEQKKFIGNAVPVPMAKALIEAFAEGLRNSVRKRA